MLVVVVALGVVGFVLVTEGVVEEVGWGEDGMVVTLVFLGGSSTTITSGSLIRWAEGSLLGEGEKKELIFRCLRGLDIGL